MRRRDRHLHRQAGARARCAARSAHGAVRVEVEMWPEAHSNSELFFARAELVPALAPGGIQAEAQAGLHLRHARAARAPVRDSRLAAYRLLHLQHLHDYGVCVCVCVCVCGSRATADSILRINVEICK